MRHLFFACFVAVFFTPFIVGSLSVAVAQVMQSGSYRIQSDSINFGGGLSTSTNYQQESTFGEIATGESGSATYNLKAGYQQMQEVYIAISAAADVTMSPSLGGISGGTSNGSTTVTVTTDSPSGYALTIRASGTPAMQKGADTIPDYAPAGADPDYTFTIPSGSAVFGYTPEGVNVVTRFPDNGSACNTGGMQNGALTCWDGLSTTTETIASSASANHPLGATTSISFRVGIPGDGSVSVPPGSYVATTTLTALPL